ASAAVPETVQPIPAAELPVDAGVAEIVPVPQAPAVNGTASGPLAPEPAAAAESLNDQTESAAAAFAGAANASAGNTNGRARQPKEIDLADEDLFPALGLSSAAKQRPAPAAPSPAGGPPSMAAQLRQNRVSEAVDLPMAATSVAAAVRAIATRTKTTIEVSHNTALQTSTYVVGGRREAVARAKREICAQLSPQVTRVVQVPAAVRAQIAGVRGRALQAIEAQTHTRIALGKAPRDDGEFAVVDVTITGDHASVTAAAAQIEAAVDQRTTRRAARINDVPRDAHALLVGKDGAGLAALQATHTGVQIRIPGPLDADAAIALVGERDAVQAAAADLRAAAQALLQNSRTATVAVPKRQHRFVVGAGGQTLVEIMRATGCSVAVPAPGSPSEHVTVRGPESALGAAAALVMAKAQSAAIETVDPSALHEYSQPLLYVRRALQYFHDRNRFRRIESEHGVTLRVPTVAQAVQAKQPSQVLIEVQGRDAHAVAAARDALTALFAAFPPFHFNSIDVEPHLHALLASGGATTARLQAARSVYALFPADPSARDVLVVYEGFNPDIERAAPAAREAAVRALLRTTLEEFRKTMQQDTSFTATTVEVPAAMQRVLDTDAVLKVASVEGHVALRLGSASDAAPASTRVQRETELGDDEIEVKGRVSDVERVVAELQRRVAAAAERERQRAFRDQVAVPKALLARIIGRGGENIRRLRAERDVTVDVADGTGSAPALVKLQGTREDVAAVAAELQALAEREADQTEEIVRVAADIHRALIGSGGRYVKRLEDKYTVRIAFPSSRRDADDGAPLEPDQIRIRGGRSGVEGAKAELLELAAYEIEHSHAERFAVPAAALPHIVGRAGARITEIKDESDTRIDLGDPRDGHVSVSIVGTRAGAKAARAAIEAIVAEQDAQVDEVLPVARRHHRFLIGSGGSRVRSLVTEAGGDPDALTGAGACRIQFPRASDTAAEGVRLKGDRAVVAAVRARIEELVAERERMTTLSVAIPVTQHAFIIGRGGAQLRQLQDTHSVEIHFRSKAARADSDADPSAVRITGLPENCEAAAAALRALIRDESSITVPLALHQRVGGRNGSLWRRLRSDFDVQVDAVRVDKAPARRIDEANDHAEETAVFRDTAAGLAGLSADWVLRGGKDNLAKATELINREIATAESTVEARLRIESHLHRHIIGKQGATVANIRDLTGCEITVPKRGSTSQWVSVSGTRPEVEQAVELINQAVEERA
ncbi:hypothetical protein H4S01_001919, partial [Coemansia sp. RSA 2610]